MIKTTLLSAILIVSIIAPIYYVYAVFEHFTNIWDIINLVLYVVYGGLIVVNYWFKTLAKHLEETK